MAKKAKTQNEQPAQVEETFSFIEPVEERKAFNVDDFEEDEVLESGAEFYNFEEDGTTLIGQYKSKVIAKADGDNWSKGDTIGYTLMMANGVDVICPNNFTIAEHVDEAKPGTIFKIEFKGKSESASGRTFKKFRVTTLRKK